MVQNCKLFLIISMQLVTKLKEDKKKKSLLVKYANEVFYANEVGVLYK